MVRFNAAFAAILLLAGYASAQPAEPLTANVRVSAIRSGPSSVLRTSFRIVGDAADIVGGVDMHIEADARIRRVVVPRRLRRTAFLYHVEVEGNTARVLLISPLGAGIPPFGPISPKKFCRAKFDDDITDVTITSLELGSIFGLPIPTE